MYSASSGETREPGVLLRASLSLRYIRPFSIHTALILSHSASESRVVLTCHLGGGVCSQEPPLNAPIQLSIGGVIRYQPTSAIAAACRRFMISHFFLRRGSSVAMQRAPSSIGEDRFGSASWRF